MSDLRIAQDKVILSALKEAETFFIKRDEMNSVVHLSPCRLSPITEKVIAARKLLEERLNAEK
jgi:hypothetical protein